jgi:hypothetical protein
MLNEQFEAELQQRDAAAAQGKLSRGANALH